MLVSLSGCAGVVSLHPVALPNDKDVVFDPALVGTWEEVKADRDGAKTRYLIARAESGYSVELAPDKGKGTMHLLKIGDRYLLDVYCPSDAPPVPVHLFFKLRLDKDTAWVSEMQSNWLSEQIRTRGQLRHEVLIEDDDRIVFNGVARRTAALPSALCRRRPVVRRGNRAAADQVSHRENQDKGGNRYETVRSCAGRGTDSGIRDAGPTRQAGLPQRRTRHMHRTRHLAAFILIAALLTGCSVKRMAVNKLGNALASGGSTFSGDDDPDLVGAALPFSLKLMESLLAESPKHRGLLVASANGFVAYSNLYVDQQADLAEAESLDRSLALRARARKLYLRAHEYGMRGLEAAHPGFRSALEKEPASALAGLQKRDVPLLYWTAAAQGLAISTSKDQADMIAQLPVVEALIDRVKELDAGFGQGAVPEFMIAFEAGRSGINPDEQQKRIRAYYEQALQLSGGKRAGIYVSYAENSCLQLQKRAEFQAVLGQALKVDPDQDPDNRLVNLMAQRRARWLLSRMDELFLEARPSGGQL